VDCKSCVYDAGVYLIEYNDVYCDPSLNEVLWWGANVIVVVVVVVVL